MSALQVLSLDGSSKSLDDTALESLRSGLRGELITPTDAGYDAAREIWNAMIDKRPGAIARCTGTADVMHVVQFAKANGLAVSVRGAGHNIAGKSLLDGAILIDLSGLRSVTVDVDHKVAVAGPGATLGDLDHETQAHGLAVPVGINSTTGVAGLTLGGGFGWLSRKYGMTIDNLLGAEVVTADGSRVWCDEQNHPDLFWAIRGGGGNFGVVTSFRFQCHEVGPEVMSGPVVYPFDNAGGILREYRDLCKKAPEELTVWAVLRGAPPLPFLPEDVHGQLAVIVVGMYNGPMDQADAAFAPFRKLGTPHGDAFGPHPFAGFQAAFDPLLTPGFRNYWKSHNFTELSDDLLDKLVTSVSNLPSPHSEIFIAQMGGANNKAAGDAMAYGHRNVEFTMNVHTRWETQAEDNKCRDWARKLYDETLPHATGSVYVNFMSDDEADRVEDGAYGKNYKKLAEIKAKYDPDNFFRVNQNIKPQ